jgi:hypothetical protein
MRVRFLDCPSFDEEARRNPTGETFSDSFPCIVCAPGRQLRVKDRGS